MTKDLSRIAQKFLSELSVDPAFSTANELIEVLEEKVDPDPIEITMIDKLYDFVEKLKVLENSISSYVRKSREVLPGNKLQDLYNDNSFDGSGSIFKS